LASNITKKLGVNGISFVQLTLTLVLQHLVKFRSRILAVYSNELKLGSACFGSEMINGIATNTSNSYYLSKNLTYYITSFLLPSVLKMSPPARTQAVDVDATRQQHVQ